jgi:hypothetical protein
MSALVRNPEFRRNLWLEFSPQRLILMPLVILLVLFVIGKFGADHAKEIANIILKSSLLGFVGLTTIWGCIQASSALRQEFSDGTWDNQRMSSLTPWQMTWGKLLGSTLYAWYGGGILLLIALLAGAIDAETGSQFANALRACVGLALLALLVQVSSMMQMLLIWQRHPGKVQGRIGIIGSLILIWILGSSFSSLFGRYPTKMMDGGLLWYGMKAGADFLLFSLFSLVAWAVIGLWQLMRRELLLRNRPWWWLAFLLFWMAWGGGFITRLEEDQRWALFFMFCAMLTWVSVYVLIFFEKKDTAFWIRLLAAWKRRDGALLQHLLPNWLVSFALALLLSLLALLLSGPDHLVSKLLFFISITAFALRDTAWILWLNLNPGARRPDGAALVSLAIAYGVLPWLSTRIFFPFVGIFSPFLFSSPKKFFSPSPLVILALHLLFAAAALWLLYTRFHKTFGEK